MKIKCVDGPYRAKNKKTHRRQVAIITLVLVLTIVGILCSRTAVSQKDPDMYIVHKGDTLWGICKQVYGDMQDTREMVYLMRKLNNIEDPGALQPGMKLYLPVVVD
jgi:nucleoid-associated protein YgaU